MSALAQPGGVPDILEQPLRVADDRRSLTIGLPRPGADRRFPLTPEGAAMLVDRGYRIKIEEGAAAPLHYTDEAYTHAGAEVTSLAEALACDIVIRLSPLGSREIAQMRRGAMLMTLLHPEAQTREAVETLLSRHIMAIALDLVEDGDGNTPFADILAEIDGRSAMMAASALLSTPYGGKGILLGGVAGIVPCEVTILGSGIAARAAARSAFGLGAMVRMFDNDVYSLRRAQHSLGEWVVGSALHPRVVSNALGSADVVVNTLVPTPASPFTIDTEMACKLKREALVFDLSTQPGRMTPSLGVQPFTGKAPSGGRVVCMTDPGSATPRTAAMAMTNTFATLLGELTQCEGAVNAMRLLPGIQKAAYTFMGKAVNREIARIAGVRHMDINMILTLS
ncbi:MAG: hypothetical protein NC342_07640 [Pseudoflavonifractor sp.]|nr:hypothetical protein [Alloprevotella sp.]MCM1117392.1 hypothetical protein [Pseudoflavonifractor sp.]